MARFDVRTDLGESFCWPRYRIAGSPCGEALAGTLLVDDLRHYREVWLVDAEYRQPNGEHPEPHCIVAREYRSGRTHRLWADELTKMSAPPFGLGDDSLMVAFYASAELNC